MTEAALSRVKREGVNIEFSGTTKGGRTVSQIEIMSRQEPEVQQLFGLAKMVFGDAPGWSDRRVLEALDEDVVFVAREHGRPAGYVALHGDAERAMVVDQLFVAPGHERHGVGHRLLDHAEGYAIAVGAETLFIAVEEDNVAARSFYRRCGFVPVERELFELVLPRRGWATPPPCAAS